MEPKYHRGQIVGKHGYEINYYRIVRVLKDSKFGYVYLLRHTENESGGWWAKEGEINTVAEEAERG